MDEIVNCNIYNNFTISYIKLIQFPIKSKYSFMRFTIDLNIGLNIGT